MVVGAGLAGFRAAQALRNSGFDREIVVVGDEEHMPYDRPPLSKQFLSGTFTQEQCMLPGEAAHVVWRLGTGAKALDRSSSEVVLSDGERLPYDGLIIATGRRSRAWPGPLPDSGVHMLRSFSDVTAFESELTDSSKVVIVGAGFIGCEVAATLRARSIDVTVVDVSTTPMPVLGTVAGERAKALHEAHGVRFRLGVGVREIAGVGQVEAVVLDGGERLEADVVLVAIGSAPNTEWLEGSGLSLDAGVVACDATCTVLDLHGHPIDSIMAAGDVAAWPHPHASGAVCIEHWSNARDMGDLAASNILLDQTDRQVLRSVPAFWSDQYNVKIKSAGFLRGVDSLTVISEDPAKPSLLVEARRDDEVVGAIAFNMNRAMIGYQRDLAAAMV